MKFGSCSVLDPFLPIGSEQNRVRPASATCAYKFALASGDVEAGYRRVARWIPQRRASNAAEIAEAVAWLPSPAASFLNGSVINVDAGESTVCPSLTEFDT